MVAFGLAAGMACGTSSKPTVPDRIGVPDTASTSVGNKVGDRIIPFTVRLIDGSTVTSDELLSQGQPVFVFFFKPGCSVCFAEARQLKGIYPPYANKIVFLALNYAPTLELDHDKRVWDQENWPWLIGEPMGTMPRDYWVIASATKIAIDSHGVIIYRAGFGEGSGDEFRKVFDRLVASG